MFYFLELPSLSNWLKSPGTSLITVIEAAIRLILYTINSLLYRGIRSLYNVFIALCNGQILDSDTLNGLFGRIGLLLGVIMMFRVAFSFIQVLINPDSFNDNQKGIPNIIKKVILVIIMFGMSSYVFSFLRTLQSEIIESNVISKFLLPQQVETENFGGALEAELFTAFYNLDPALDYQTTNECASEDYINGLKNSIANNNSFSYKKQCVTELGTIKEDGSPAYFISFNFIFSTLVAVATLYFLLNYCISVGVRIVQLAALQIMSPMAIVGYLSPKSDNMFTKWVKVYFSTYIDAFLRMAIINFAVYIIAILIQGFNDKDSIFFTSVGYAAGEHKKLIYVIMIMAIFTFAKKAPDLLKKIFPATSESGIGLGLDKDNLPALGTAAAVGGLGVAAGIGTAKKLGGSAKNRVTSLKKDWKKAANNGDKAKAVWNNVAPFHPIRGYKNAVKNFDQDAKDNGTLNALRTRASKFGNSVKKGGRLVGDVKNVVTSGKSASSAFDLISKAKGGYQGASFSTNNKINSKLEAFNYINSKLKDDGKVKDAQAELDAVKANVDRFIGADGKIDQVAYDRAVESADKHLKEVQEARFVASDSEELQSAKRATGLQFEDLDDFKEQKKHLEAEAAGKWKPKDNSK